MDEYKIQKQTLDNIADAINAKTSESSQINLNKMVEKMRLKPKITRYKSQSNINFIQ